MNPFRISICCFGIPESTSVVKGKSVPVTTFSFIEQGSKLIFVDGVVLFLKLGIVRGCSPEKLDDKRLARIVFFM